MTVDVAKTPAETVRQCDCTNCGAAVVYSASEGALICNYCDSEFQVADQASQASPRERALDDLFRAAASGGLSTSQRSVSCQQCGASVSLPENTKASQCAFCASHLVVERSANPNLVRPETIIPFKVDKDQAVHRFRGWLGGLWFRPNGLKRLARLSQIQGVYTPFWTFDAQAEVVPAVVESPVGRPWERIVPG